MSTRFIHPRYWPTWLGLALLYPLAFLPWRAQLALGRLLGGGLYYLARRRRHIVAINLRIAFPEWDDKQRQQQIRAVFAENGIGMLEANLAHHRSIEWLRPRIELRGLELLEQAKARGRGVLLLGAHYSQLDLGGAITALYTQVDTIYRPHNNPLMDAFIQRGRARFVSQQISRDNMRQIIKSLKAGRVVWYAPDQDYGGRHAVFVPFFGHPAATITATARLAQMSRAAVLLLNYRRKTDDSGYILEFEAAPEGYPCGDAEADASTINLALEQMIRRAPAQYMWTHRRYKTQPQAKGALYR